MVAALSENFLDPIFLAKVAFAHKLDVAAVFRRQPLGILPQPVAERLGEPRVVENADVALVQVRGHALGKADPRQRAEQQDPIPAGKRPRDLGCVTFRQQRQAHSGIIPWSNNLFGSGYAGLGYTTYKSMNIYYLSTEQFSPPDQASPGRYADHKVWSCVRFHAPPF